MPQALPGSAVLSWNSRNSSCSRIHCCACCISCRLRRPSCSVPLSIHSPQYRHIATQHVLWSLFFLGTRGFCFRLTRAQACALSLLGSCRTLSVFVFIRVSRSVIGDTSHGCQRYNYDLSLICAVIKGGLMFLCYIGTCDFFREPTTLRGRPSTNCYCSRLHTEYRTSFYVQNDKTLIFRVRNRHY